MDLQQKLAVIDFRKELQIVALLFPKSRVIPCLIYKQPGMCKYANGIRLGRSGRLEQLSADQFLGLVANLKQVSYSDIRILLFICSLTRNALRLFESSKKLGSCGHIHLDKISRPD